jgi:LysM repeat protein
MKAHAKIVLLVALVLLLAVTACTRQATTKSSTTLPTATGEVPFPFTTPGGGSVSDFGTQTAVAKTPQVVIATNTPEVATGEQPAAAPTAEGQQEVGGGIAATQAPAPAQVAAVNTPVVERPGAYTLQKGEWPICIARRYDLDISTFFSMNGLNMDSKPGAGVSLKIPSSGTWSGNYGNRSLKAHPASYTVLGGDSVYSIACKYGDVTPEAILAVNGLGSAGDLKAGMTINIP